MNPAAGSGTGGGENTFESLGLARCVLGVLQREGYTTPTPIQVKAIPPVLAGKDVLGCAQTGTGKTAAFALPIIQRLAMAPVDKTRRGPILPRALILSPTRELATQIDESFATYGSDTHLRHTVVFGGVSQFHQVRALRAGVEVLVATPGRLIDLLDQGHVSLREVQVFVLDEADRMLDMGFIHPIRMIAGALPAGRQTLMFSATMPREIMGLADSLLRNPVKVAVTPVASTVPLIEQLVCMVPRARKQAMLHHMLRAGEVSRAVVFTRTKHGADRVMRKLNAAGLTAEAIHGNKAQNQRQRALLAFRTGRSRVLVATDVAARGLDVDGITHVFNFDLPIEPEGYVHRIGRTGRAGAAGIAISFCDGEERDLLRDIERVIGKRVPVMAAPEGVDYAGVDALTAGDAAPRREDFRSRPTAPRGGPARRQGGGGGYRGGHANNNSHPHPAHAPQAPHAPRAPHAAGGHSGSGRSAGQRHGSGAPAGAGDRGAHGGHRPGGARRGSRGGW